MPINDGTTWNLLTHYGQLSIENTRAHTVIYVNTPTRDTQDNDMFYYFLADSLTNDFRTMVRKQMDRLHAREQEAVDLLYYLWKA